MLAWLATTSGTGTMANSGAPIQKEAGAAKDSRMKVTASKSFTTPGGPWDVKISDFDFRVVHKWADYISDYHTWHEAEKTFKTTDRVEIIVQVISNLTHIRQERMNAAEKLDVILRGVYDRLEAE